MTKNIFFDYDGTLINSKKRMYNLFRELCPENAFTYQEYWKIKRAQINQNDFLKKYFNYSDEQIKIFKKKWMEKIEEEQRMLEDKPFEDINILLGKLAIENTLYIVTNRQSKDLAIEQIKSFSLFDFFDKILVTEQKKTKTTLVRENVNVTSSDVFIGDTGEDILTAKELGLQSIAVTYGFLNKQALSEYNPNLIIDKVKDFDNCKYLY